MAIALDTRLDLIRDKVEAGERLDLEDGLALIESDDLLAIGELADLARRRARRRRPRLLHPEPLPQPDERLPREVQVLRVRGDAEAGARLHDDAATSSSRTRSRSARLTGFTEIHMVNGENPHVDFDFYVETIAQAARGAAGRVPQVLHGVRDPPHDDALGA